MRPPLSLKGRALALLAQREQSVAELRRKLGQHARRMQQAAKAAETAAAVSAPRSRPDAALSVNRRKDVGSCEGVDVDSCGRMDVGLGGRGDCGASSEAVAFDPAAQVDEVIEWLRQHDYLNEQRFVETRVHARAGRFGMARIRRELAEHGLALSPEAAADLRESEWARAAAVWQRKFGQPPIDTAAQARQTRFLIARGFSADVVRPLVRLGAGSATHARRAREDDSERPPDEG